MSKTDSFRGRVPPGSETGIYYIPIGNLPFNASWQRLKDFVRQVASVDHIEIFPSSTSGWVRVKGHENFRRAFKHLDGGVFQGRALIAKGDNATKEIMIRDLHLPAEPTAVSTTTTTYATPPFSPTMTSEYMQSEYPRSEYTQSEYPHSEYPQTEYSASDFRQARYRQSTRGPETAHLDARACTCASTPSTEYADPYPYYPQGASLTAYELPIRTTYATTTTAAVASPHIYAPVPTYPGAAYYDHTASSEHPAGSYYDSTHPTATPDPYYTAAVPPPTTTTGPVSTTSSSPAYYSDEFYLPPTTTTTAAAAAASTTAATTTTTTTTSGRGGVGTSNRAPTGNYIGTEKRKLFIKDISYRATKEQIVRFVRERADADVAAIIDISVPQDADGKLKYIAFVLFSTADAARRVERRLHREKFKGREISCRLTSEGVSDAETSARGGKKPRGGSGGGGSGGGGGGGGGGGSSSRRDRERKVVGSGSGSRSTTTTTTTSGSGNRARSTTTTTAAAAFATGGDGGSSSDSGDKSSVVIADGSSKRRSL